jgi:hypothetical protein
VAAHAVLILHAALGHIEYLRILVHQPRRRRRRRRADDHLQLVLLRQRDRAIKQLEAEAAFLRLKERPGELSDADHRETQLAHPSEVVGPQLLGPVFGIITYPQLQTIQIQGFCHCHDTSVHC